MKRETGYYWCIVGNASEWIIGHYSSIIKTWLFMGNNSMYYEEDFIEIDERPIIRQPNMTTFGEDQQNLLK